MSRIKQIVVAAFMAFALLVIGGTSAQATTDALTGHQNGGRVVNSMYSTNTLKIFNSFSTEGNYQYLPIKYPSDYYYWFHDTDMFFVGSGCVAKLYNSSGAYLSTRYGPIHYTIGDTANIAVIYKCS